MQFKIPTFKSQVSTFNFQRNLPQLKTHNSQLSLSGGEGGGGVEPTDYGVRSTDYGVEDGPI